jgi:hypothetical protein
MSLPQAFIDLCCDVYNILREHSTLLVSLFSLAIPCSLPELQTEKVGFDILYNEVVWIVMVESFVVFICF